MKAYRLVIYSIIFLIEGCGQEKINEVSWYRNHESSIGLYLQLDHDHAEATYYYSSPDSCRIRVLEYHTYFIIHKAGNMVFFAFNGDSTGVLNLYGDSIKICGEFLNDSECLTLIKTREWKEAKKLIGDKNKTLNDFLSEEILFQEQRINSYQESTTPDTITREYINFLDSLKRDFVARNLGIEYRNDICWTKVHDLEKVELYPRGIKNVNYYYFVIRQATEMFRGYMKLKNLPDSIDENAHTIPSQLSGPIEELANIKITNGEILIYYNHLILEIYRLDNEAKGRRLSLSL